VPARRFERDDESLRYFTRLWGNHKYVVYQTLSGDREAEAKASADAAMQALLAGRLDEAEALAIQALAIDKHSEEALTAMRHVGSLIEQGVRPAPAFEMHEMAATRMPRAWPTAASQTVLIPTACPPSRTRCRISAGVS
jgi:hypothetical protein